MQSYLSFFHGTSQNIPPTKITNFQYFSNRSKNPSKFIHEVIGKIVRSPKTHRYRVLKFVGQNGLSIFPVACMHLPGATEHSNRKYNIRAFFWWSGSSITPSELGERDVYFFRHRFFQGFLLFFLSNLLRKNNRKP